MKKVIFRIIGIVIVLAAAWGTYRFIKQLPQRQAEIATTKALRGDVVIRAYSRGELRAVRSVTLTAPNLFGAVQVTRLAPMGSLARDKNLIVEFDDSERRAQLEETLLEVEQIDEQIKKAKADLAIRDSQDEVDLLRTRYSVRRAELEVKRNPIISPIDAKKNDLTLEEQRRRFKQLESDIRSRREQAQAELAVLYEERKKSMIDVSREKQRIAQAKLLSPMTGLVAIRQNRTGFFMFGQQIPDIREGDTLRPGMPVADVLDLSDMEVVAKVGELDRANLHEGQDVLIQLDAVPDARFHGKIKSMSGTASSNVFSGDPAKKFDVVFSLDMRRLLTHLGMKPAEVDQLMDTAARNARKAPPAMAPAGPPQGMRRGPNGEMAGGRHGPGAGMGRAAGEAAPEAGEQGAPQARGRGAGEAGGAAPAGPPAMPALPGGNAADLARFTSIATMQFSEEDRANAKLPLPPEQDSQLKVLLRPGLLADIEIIVEKIPNALHVPAQAVFEKEGRQIVYVKKNGRFEERPIELAKRSENTMVLKSGLEPGEVVALADPTAAKGSKAQDKSKGGAKGMGMMPAGGAKQ